MVFQKNHLAGSMLKGEYPLYAHVISIYIYIYIRHYISIVCVPCEAADICIS